MSNAEMSTTKQVKVDNWGVFFLQRLKHFFNKTDYCDLTLQFQDYAQLKVHRLVLNACTEYFELLERTCEMYDDCLIMPDDLQADVVVPIVNFMYTGQLEYEFELYDRLYSTAQIMNMTVLTKLLDAQKVQPKTFKKNIVVMNDQLGEKKSFVRPSTSGDFTTFQSPKKRIITSRKYGPGPGLKPETPGKMIMGSGTPNSRFSKQPKTTESARPTRYEIPEELDSEDIFESSFSDISYESRPLMRHSKAKNDESLPRNIYDEASSSRKFEELRRGVSYKRPRTSSSEVPDSKHIDLDQVNEYAYQQKLRSEYIEQDGSDDDNTEMFDPLNVDFDKDSSSQISEKEDPNSLFGHMATTSNTQTLSVKPGKDSGSSLNHAKIISEVLKKYPHLVKSNKNIKLKIMTGPNKCDVVTKSISKNIILDHSKKYSTNSRSNKHVDEDLKPDWTYVSKHMNSEAMANLVSKGAENTTGPWLCLICGTPGKALNFLSYNKYYHHLVDVHKEKISANICEYCGYKSGKRNHLLHHLYTKHNVPPPSTHSFPKCNLCSYVALTEAFLIKHKMSHTDNRDFSCNVCNSSFRTRSQLLAHIQASGHKISPDRKASNQCVYCNKIFLREANLYTHLKLAHKEIARRDGIIDNSDEEETYDDEIKYEQNVSYQYSPREHVSIKEEYDGKIQIISNMNMSKSPRSPQQKILNSKLMNQNMGESAKKGYSKNTPRPETTVIQTLDHSSEADAMDNVASGIAASLGLVDRIVVLNDNEYILQSGQDGDVSMEHTIGRVQVGLDGVTQEIILSNVPGDDYSQQSTIDVAMPQQTRTTQIMAAKPPRPLPKPGQSVRTIIAGQNQPIQIMVSGNQQFKNIMSSTPIIYSNSNDLKTNVTAVTNVSQTGNINLGNAPEGHVMVLQEGDYGMAESMPTDGSNIMVVYSHPVDNGGKEYLQVEHNQFENITDHQEIETHMQQIHGESGDSSAVLSDQGLVHETVETWHEESVIEALQDDLKEEVTECVETEEFPQDIPKISEENIQVQQSLEEVVTTEEIQQLQDNSSLVESEPNEVVISSHEAEKPEEEEACESDVQQMDATCESVEAEVFSEQLTASSEENVELQENGVILDPQQCMEIDNSVNYDIEESAKQELPKENVQKLALEWSDDDTTSKEIRGSTQVLDVSENIPTENIEETSTPMEVEESIENIQEEVQKHIQDASKMPKPELTVEPTDNTVEEQSTDIKSNDHLIESRPEEVHLEDTEDSESPREDLEEDVSKKEKTVEKISTLLNDWDDNDSQLEAMEVDGKKTLSIHPKDSNIDKLVSDWDDEDDK